MSKHSNKKQKNSQQVSKGYLERQVDQMYHVDNEFGFELGPTTPLDKKSSRDTNDRYSNSQATKNMNRK